MGLTLDTMRCSVRLAIRKLAHPGSVQGSVLQGFRRLTLELRNGGKVVLGERSQSRSGLTLIADGGVIEVGAHCQFNTNVSVTALESVRIGERCSLANMIDDLLAHGNSVVIVDHDHAFGGVSAFDSAEVVLGDDVWVGANAVILKGVHVADHCVIAAGAVVTKDVQPAYSVWGGCPARMISSRSDVHEK